METFLRKHFTWLWLILIITFAFIAYYPSLNNQFLLVDDDQYITANPHIRDLSAKGIKRFFTNTYVNSYVPLTMLTWAIEYHFFGQDHFHYILNNLILHILSTILVFFLIRSIFQSEIYALITAAIFALHPVHVESVAWATERKDVLFAFFYLLGLNFYLLFSNSEKRKKLWWLLTFIAYILALFSKTQAITFPLAIVLIDYFRNKPLLTKNYILTLVPYIVLSLIFGVITLWAQKYFEPGYRNFRVYNFSVVNQIVLSLFGLLKYLYISFYPFELSAVYPLPSNPHRIPAYIKIGALASIAVLYLVFRLRKRNPVIFFAFGFFVVHLITVLNAPSFTNNIIADRFLYLPIIGIGVFFAYIFKEFLSPKVSLYPASILMVVWLGVLGYLTYERCKVWKNEEVLFTDAIKKYPNNPIAYEILGHHYYFKEDYNIAYKNALKALKQLPGAMKFHKLLGLTYIKLGKSDSAILHLNKSLEVTNPNDILELSTTYFELGEAYRSMLNHQKAIEYFNAAIEARPSSEKYKVGLIISLVDANEIKKAKNKIDSLKLSYEYINYTKSYLLNHIGKNDSALILINKSIKINKNNPKFYRLRGRIYAQHLKDYPKAIKDYKEAIKLEPKELSNYNNLAIIYSLVNDVPNAEKMYRKCIELSPNSCYPYVNLGVLFLQNKQYDKAYKYLLEAEKMNCQMPQPLKDFLLSR